MFMWLSIWILIGAVLATFVLSFPEPKEWVQEHIQDPTMLFMFLFALCLIWPVLLKAMIKDIGGK